jgi:bifunctional N-acetylglucosamine-1-phosphate-uridyltransferase/glucosamine-1-phosphate-acetyltransferase GlmU-like protein
MSCSSPQNILILVPEATKGMKSIGSKALLKIYHDITLIDYQIMYCKKFYKNSSITVLTGFENEKIKKQIKKYKSVSILHNDKYNDSNQAQSLMHYIITKKPSNLLLINNGVLLKEKLPISQKTALFVLPKNKDGFSIGIQDPTKVEYLFYGLKHQWSECIFMNNRTIKSIQKLSKLYKLDHLYIFELVNLLINNNIDIEPIAIRNTKNIYKINTLDDIKRVKNFYDKSIFV